MQRSSPSSSGSLPLRPTVFSFEGLGQREQRPQQLERTASASARDRRSPSLSCAVNKAPSRVGSARPAAHNSAAAAPASVPLWRRSLSKEERKTLPKAAQQQSNHADDPHHQAGDASSPPYFPSESIDFGIRNTSLLALALERYEVNEKRQKTSVPTAAGPESVGAAATSSRAPLGQRSVNASSSTATAQRTSASTLSKCSSRGIIGGGGAVRASSSAGRATVPSPACAPDPMLSRRQYGPSSSPSPFIHGGVLAPPTEALFTPSVALQFEAITPGMIEGMERRHAAQQAMAYADAQLAGRQYAAQQRSMAVASEALERERRRAERRLRVASAAAFSPVV